MQRFWRGTLSAQCALLCTSPKGRGLWQTHHVTSMSFRASASEPRNLRIHGYLCSRFGAKILPLASLGQDDRCFCIGRVVRFYEARWKPKGWRRAEPQSRPTQNPFGVCPLRGGETMACSTPNSKTRLDFRRPAPLFCFQPPHPPVS